MAWRVRIEGDQIDLMWLAHHFDGEQYHVGSDKNGYYLSARQFEAITSSEGVLQSAERVIEELNGILLQWGQEAVGLAGVIERVGDDGSRDVYIHPPPARARAGVVAPVITVDGEANRDNTRPVVNLLRMAESNPQGPAARVLRLRGSVHDWTSLYNVLDTIREDLGGEQHITDAGWAPANEVERFRRTANSYKAAGDRARHGKSFEPPSKPMSLNEAESLIKTIVERWLESKLQQWLNSKEGA